MAMSTGNFKNNDISELVRLAQESLEKDKKILDQETVILNLIEELGKAKKEIGLLKDEIKKLKGEKGKPDIKPSVDSESDKNTKKKRKTGNWKKSSKAGKIQVTRTERIQIDRSTLPEDARYKGSRAVIIQDLKIELDNIEFILEKFYSEIEGKTYESNVPKPYQGSTFGPGLRHFIIVMHYQGRLPQKLLHTILTSMGIIISEGEIAGILVDGADNQANEMAEAQKAAIVKAGYQHIDDTGARIAGKNGATIVTCNDYFVGFKTGFSKNRLAALCALGNILEPVYLIDDFTLKYVKQKLPKKSLQKILAPFCGTGIMNTEEFFRKVIYETGLDGFHEYVIKHVNEGAAIAAFRANCYGTITRHIICDDAGQFKGLTEFLQLCWIHIGRHFKNLNPINERFKLILDKFLKRFWDYYGKLKEYKISPDPVQAAILRLEFDGLFIPDTGYYALDAQINKVIPKKELLLEVLNCPDIPLHNNPAELEVREKVVQRKIRNCHRSTTGAHASDIFLGIKGTCRKLKISFWDFTKDRLFDLNKILNLKTIIENHN